MPCRCRDLALARHGSAPRPVRTRIHASGARAPCAGVPALLCTQAGAGSTLSGICGCLARAFAQTVMESLRLGKGALSMAQSKDQRSVGSVLAAARQMLEFARQGADDYAAGGERRMPGLFNAVTSGRSVTFVLQGLRGKADGFDEWYEGVQDELKADAASRWFVQLRNRIEKEGEVGSISNRTYISHLNSADLQRAAPPGTISTFIGDRFGRNGWIVGLADGSQTTLYFSLPAEIGRNTLHLEGAPGGQSIEELLPLWLDLLDEIVNSAEDTWGAPPNNA